MAKSMISMAMASIAMLIYQGVMGKSSIFIACFLFWAVQSPWLKVFAAIRSLWNPLNPVSTIPLKPIKNNKKSDRRIRFSKWKFPKIGLHPVLIHLFNGHATGSDLLEVPTIYKAHKFQAYVREYPHKRGPNKKMYLRTSINWILEISHWFIDGISTK